MPEPGPSDPSLVSASVVAYRLLLAFYPAQFRRAYGAPMLQLFRDCCLKAHRQAGRPGLARLWARTLVDWSTSVLEEQMTWKSSLTKAKFIRLSGWGLVAAAVALLLSFLPEAGEIQAGLYRIVGAPASAAQAGLVETVTSGARWLPLPLAVLLVTIGLMGLGVRYGEAAGKWARLALAIGVLGGAAGLVINILTVTIRPVDRPLWNSAIAVMFGGLFAFGLVALRKKPMASGNGLAALAGFWWPFFVIHSTVYFQVTGHSGPPVPFWLSFAMFSIMSASLALLGYVLQADLPQEETVLLQV